MCYIHSEHSIRRKDREYGGGGGGVSNGGVVVVVVVVVVLVMMVAIVVAVGERIGARLRPRWRLWC